MLAVMGEAWAFPASAAVLLPLSQNHLYAKMAHLGASRPASLHDGLTFIRIYYFKHFPQSRF